MDVEVSTVKPQIVKKYIDQISIILVVSHERSKHELAAKVSLIFRASIMTSSHGRTSFALVI